MSALAERIAALRAAGATEITVSRKGAVRAKFPPVVAAPLVPVQPTVNPLPWQPVTPTAPPWIGTSRPDCVFDGLPPGVYGLVCTCRKCQPHCFGAGVAPLTVGGHVAPLTVGMGSALS